MHLTETEFAVQGVYLGLDLGQARCGLGVAAALAATTAPAIATPLAVVQTRPQATLATRIRQTLGQRQPVALIAGLPLNARGESGQSAVAVQAMAECLQAELSQLYGTSAPLPLHFVDERFSTAAALAVRRNLHAPPVRGKARHTTARELRAGIDAQVAAELLQSWLDTRPGG
jgi:putative transcription antitermination factor YqgF